MHQRYSHSGGYDRRTNHHIDHLQERDKNGQFSKPQFDRPRIELRGPRVRRMRTANLLPAMIAVCGRKSKLT